MQGPSTPQQPGKPALRSGVLLGVALGIIHSAIVIITSQMNNGIGNTPLPTIFLYLVTPLIWIVGLLAAGAAGSRITGKISTGTLAGLFAGTFGGVIAGFGQAIATVISTNQSTTDPASSGLLLAAGFTAMFFVMVLALGAGAGFGALGGLIGQSMSNVRPQPQQPAPSAYPPAVIPYYMPPQQAPATPQQVPLPHQPEMFQLPEQ
jgi:hypothetical protein